MVSTDHHNRILPCRGSGDRVTNLRPITHTEAERFIPIEALLSADADTFDVLFPSWRSVVRDIAAAAARPAETGEALQVS